MSAHELHELLTTNIPPSALGESHARQSLRDVDARLRDVRARIATTQLTLDALLADQTILESLQTKWTGVLSPLRRMLPELIAEFLLHALPQATPPSPQDVLRLAQICSQWRAVVLSTQAF